MGFAAIAVGIGIGAACGRQAIPPEICLLKIPNNDLHLRRFAVKTKIV